MSGSIGAYRIAHKNVQPTFDKYLEVVLENVPGFKGAAITGSYNTGGKEDYGDLDIVVWIDSDKELPVIKKGFQRCIENSGELMMFKRGKNAGKYTQLYGAIVTCSFPIEGNEFGQGVQVDNIIVKDYNSYRFTQNFLNMDAAKQALVTALTRLMGDKNVGDAKGRKALYPLESNQEYEYVLGQTQLTLRRVTLNENRKEIARENLAKYPYWDCVVELLDWIDLDWSYERMLREVAKNYRDDERARKRICGVMKSMINIGPGEVGTSKGINKQMAIDTAYELLNINPV